MPIDCPAYSVFYDGDVFSLTSALVEIEAPDTRTLLARALAGDADAFGEACRAYETRLLRQALALCGETSLAEDLAQDTLVEAWRSLRRYNRRCRFFTWLCAILLNRYRNTLRARRARPLASLAGNDETEFQDSIDTVTDHRSSPDQAAHLCDQASLVRACIQSLPTKHQQVIYLRFYADDSLEGIAMALGCSVGTVKSRLFHALDKLRRMNTLCALAADSQTKVETL